MDINQIATKKDIDELKEFFKETIKEEFFKIENPSNPIHPKWVRAKVAREILQVSPNTLKKMRMSNLVIWSYLGSIYYYDYESIMQTLEQNTIKQSK